jgi:hypothetical protein
VVDDVGEQGFRRHHELFSSFGTSELQTPIFTSNRSFYICFLARNIDLKSSDY